jgi:hypothetical protein
MDANSVVDSVKKSHDDDIAQLTEQLNQKPDSGVL